MKEYPFPYRWRELPGNTDELDFLEKRFEEMSVREQAITAGVCQMEPIESVADLINITGQLHHFELLFQAADEEGVRRYVGKRELHITEQQAPFINYAEIGRNYMAQHPCVFVGKGCVVQERPCQPIYNGHNLAAVMPDDPMRIKLASKDCPEGVWLLVPDGEINSGPHEMAVALDALGTNTWSGTWVLDIRCRFSNLQNITEQYDSVEAFLLDANNFGYIYEEAGQGQWWFYEHWQAAMELENCTTLAQAIDISQNLHCYDFVPGKEHWEQYGRNLATKSGILKGNADLSPYFNYEAYAATEKDRLGLVPCGQGFIRRNEQTFFYEYSTPPTQEGELQFYR